MAEAFRVENLLVYQRLCDLHIELCDICRTWPIEERFELASQVRRASNSSPANLAEKHNDRHARNRIEGVNRARGEALETVHHLFVAHRKHYLTLETYETLRERYLECVRMLNGLERNYEKSLEPESRAWPSSQQTTTSDSGRNSQGPSEL
jgi:four helix bundle protein